MFHVYPLYDSFDVQIFVAIKAFADSIDPTLCWNVVKEYLRRADLLTFRVEARLSVKNYYALCSHQLILL